MSEEKSINTGNRSPNIKVTPELLTRSEEILEKLFKHTIENHEGCWLWTKSCFSSGYGQQKTKGKNWKVHRLIYSLLNKDFDSKLIVRHRCGNRLCCNPLHLEEGTLEDNAKDSRIHGTSHFHNINQFGVNNHIAKLNEDIVYEMRKLYAAGDKTFDEIGGHFNVSRKAAERAVRGQTYPDFMDVPPIPINRKRALENV